MAWIVKGSWGLGIQNFSKGNLIATINKAEDELEVTWIQTGNEIKLQQGFTEEPKGNGISGLQRLDSKV